MKKPIDISKMEPTVIIKKVGRRKSIDNRTEIVCSFSQSVIDEIDLKKSNLSRNEVIRVAVDAFLAEGDYKTNLMGAVLESKGLIRNLEREIKELRIQIESNNKTLQEIKLGPVMSEQEKNDFELIVGEEVKLCVERITHPDDLEKYVSIWFDILKEKLRDECCTGRIKKKDFLARIEAAFKTR